MPELNKETKISNTIKQKPQNNFIRTKQNKQRAAKTFFSVEYHLRNEFISFDGYFTLYRSQQAYTKKIMKKMKIPFPQSFIYNITVYTYIDICILSQFRKRFVNDFAIFMKKSIFTCIKQKNVRYFHLEIKMNSLYHSRISALVWKYISIFHSIIQI